MTDRERLKLLERAVGELKLTEQGYHPTGTHWRPAMRDLDKLATDLSPPPPPALTLCHPIPKGVAVSVGGLHRTAGDVSFAQNWARDFLVVAGTPILAVEAGTVTKLSGHDPSDDQADRDGVYGWSIHWETDAGYHYFLTHLGHRAPLDVGDRVNVGEILGQVGDQRFRADHGHLGVTAPSGAKLAACRRIDNVSSAKRIAA